MRKRLCCRAFLDLVGRHERAVNRRSSAFGSGDLGGEAAMDDAPARRQCSTLANKWAPWPAKSGFEHWYMHHPSRMSAYLPHAAPLVVGAKALPPTQIRQHLTTPLSWP